MAKGTYVPITPSILGWAISESGYTLAEVAEKAGVSSETILSWSKGDAAPLLGQFTKIVATLKRPTATFFLPEPPESKHVEIEFRGPRERDHRQLNPRERELVREAARLQEILSWIRRELGEGRPRLPKHSIGKNVEPIAESIRQHLQVSIAEQRNWASASQALKEWRAKVEASGIFVFQFPMGNDSCRGFSLFDTYAPAVAINTAWNQQARIFTLFHEIGHLITRTSSACMQGGNYRLAQSSDKTERWCEKFAAAVLLPWDPLKRHLVSNGMWTPGKYIKSLSVVNELAEEFHVSVRAVAIRLIQKHVAEWELYRQIPKYSDNKVVRRGGKGRVRQEISQANYGMATAQVILKGRDEQLITTADALELLHVKDVDLDPVGRARK